MNIVITGSNRGIGLELTRQYLAGGNTVYAAVRSPTASSELNQLAQRFPETLMIKACDVATQSSVDSFAAELDVPIDILINNAGVKMDTDEFTSIDLEQAAQVFNINTLGPIRVTRALYPSLRKAAGAKVVSISSGLASVANTNGGSLGYRMSKTALNMAMRTIAQETAATGMILLVLSPGWVKTDMGGAHALITPRESAAGLIAVIDGATAKESGSFLDYRGQTIAW